MHMRKKVLVNGNDYYEKTVQTLKLFCTKITSMNFLLYLRTQQEPDFHD